MNNENGTNNKVLPGDGAEDPLDQPLEMNETDLDA